MTIPISKIKEAFPLLLYFFHHFRFPFPPLFSPLFHFTHLKWGKYIFSLSPRPRNFWGRYCIRCARSGNSALAFFAYIFLNQVFVLFYFHPRGTSFAVKRVTFICTLSLRQVVVTPSKADNFVRVILQIFR